ncbi:MAG: hypothetical protein V7K77_31815 [Nostoc sp.]|uniref:hypothetical protein n=1 Tax=Nostoc sp. TaxID=1180 RepID=UPI002FF824BF
MPSISTYFDYALLYERLRQRLGSGQAQYKSLDGTEAEVAKSKGAEVHRCQLNAKPAW